MNLWIRSQDRDFLMKIDNINLGCQNDENNKVINEPRRIFTFVRDTSFTLGTYKTKERALEILDQIQNILVRINNDNEKNKMLGNIGFGTIEPKDVFIQMPKE